MQTTLNLCMPYIIISNFNYIRNLVHISDHQHHLIINAKFLSSMINNTHTMSLADMLAIHKSHMAGSILFKF